MFPVWEVLSNYWRENVMVDLQFLWKGEPRSLWCHLGPLEVHSLVSEEVF